jgi:hypothetical protein
MKHRYAIGMSVLALTGCGSSDEHGPTTSGMAIQEMPDTLSCKALCVHLDRRPNRIGEPITGTITWKGAPPGSFLNAYLSPTTDRVNRKPTVTGRYGALLVDPYPLKRPSGTIRFRWKGSGFWCAPTDYSMICDEPPPKDTYVFSAAVIDSDVSPMAVLQRRASSQPLASPNKLAGVRTTPFQLR